MFIKSYLIVTLFFFYFIVHNKDILPKTIILFFCTYMNEYSGSQRKMFFFPMASEKKIEENIDCYKHWLLYS